MSLTDKFIRWVIFLINPFVATLVSFEDYKKPIAKNIFWAFCVFYGFTFSIGNESVGSDITRYLEELQYLNHENLSALGIMAYFRASGEVDVLRIFLSFVISRFTDSQVILTTVYAVIFGFFYSRNIWYILTSLENRLGNFERLVVLVIALLIPIWFINGFRMWTAFHIFFYGLLPYIFEGRKSRLIFVFLSFLVHFSFIVPIGIVLLYFFIGNRLTVLFGFFLFSIFIIEINIQQLNAVAEVFAPENVLERSANYRNEDVIEARKDIIEERAVNWYVIWYTRGLRYSLYLLLIYIFIFGDLRIKVYQPWRRLLAFSFLFLTVGNLLVGIPSGGRFLNFGLFLSLLVLLFYIDQFREDTRTRLMTALVSPAFLLFIIVAVRNGLYSTSLMTVFGNPVLAMFNIGETSSINDFIK